MSYKKGDIVLVKFPFTNLVNYKKRPVLIIKDENSLGDIVCFQITSNFRQSNIIKIEKEHLSSALKIESYIKYDKCFTLSSNIIEKKLSSITKELLETLKYKFCNIIF